MLVVFVFLLQQTMKVVKGTDKILAEGKGVDFEIM